MRWSILVGWQQNQSRNLARLGRCRQHALALRASNMRRAMTTPITNDITRVAYSVREVAAMGLLRKSALYERINDGTLAARLAGGRRVILAADLERFIQSLPPVPVRRKRP
jgi:hypothetical protein